MMNPEEYREAEVRVALGAHVDLALAVQKLHLWLAGELAVFEHVLLHYGGLPSTHHTQAHASDPPLMVVPAFVVFAADAAVASTPGDPLTFPAVMRKREYQESLQTV